MRTEIALRDKRHLLPDVAFSVPDDLDGYESALTAAGAKVTAFEEFYSYQGEWWAQCLLPNGETVYVNGSYGSCSGCDAFEGEFGDADGNDLDYLHRLRDFGREYLSNCYTLEQAIEEAGRDIAWDTEAARMVAWLQARNTPRTDKSHMRL